MRRFRSLLALAALLVATASVAADAAPSWPQTITQDGNTLRIYPPQLDSWANRLDFTGRVAAVVTPAGGTAATGVLHITARTSTDAAHRVVALSDIQVTDAQFPTAAAADATKASALAKALMPKAGISLSLDYLLAALVQAGQTATSAPLGTTPPTSSSPSSRPGSCSSRHADFVTVAGTTVQYAINTNWPVLRTVNAPTLYLLDSTGWLTSETLTTGVWEYATQLPPDFAQLPDTKDWQDVRQNLSPAPEGQAPLLIDVSTTPAELIVVVGAPQYQQVPGTGIYTVTNTEAWCSGTATRRTTWWPAVGSAPTGSAVRGRTPPVICRRTSPTFRPTDRSPPCSPRCRTRRRRARPRCRRRFRTSPPSAARTPAPASRTTAIRNSRRSRGRHWRTPSTRRAT
jgi:hypothetical protein